MYCNIISDRYLCNGQCVARGVMLFRVKSRIALRLIHVLLVLLLLLLLLQLSYQMYLIRQSGSGFIYIYEILVNGRGTLQFTEVHNAVALVGLSICRRIENKK